MTDFEEILEVCLDDLEQGASNVDECLRRHPEHAEKLRPILLTAAQLVDGRAVRPSAAFKARARARLTQHMQAHPRKRTQFFNFTLIRLAANLAIVTAALLVAGTAYAQAALPGAPFYRWKLASEYVWRAISLDPVKTDIAIANRRIDEMNTVADDPIREAQALEGYQEVLNRLKAELDAKRLNQILPVIEVEQTPTENIENPVQPTSTPLPIVTVTPQIVTITPQVENTLAVPTSVVPLPTLPKISPTSLPKIIPTIKIPPPIP